MFRDVRERPLEHSEQSGLIDFRHFQTVSSPYFNFDSGSYGELARVRLERRHQSEFIQHCRSELQDQAPHRVDAMAHESHRRFVGVNVRVWEEWARTVEVRSQCDYGLNRGHARPVRGLAASRQRQPVSSGLTGTQSCVMSLEYDAGKLIHIARLEAKLAT